MKLGIRVEGLGKQLDFLSGEAARERAIRQALDALAQQASGRGVTSQSSSSTDETQQLSTKPTGR